MMNRNLRVFFGVLFLSVCIIPTGSVVAYQDTGTLLPELSSVTDISSEIGQNEMKSQDLTEFLLKDHQLIEDVWGGNTTTSNNENKRLYHIDHVKYLYDNGNLFFYGKILGDGGSLPIYKVEVNSSHGYVINGIDFDLPIKDIENEMSKYGYELNYEKSWSDSLTRGYVAESICNSGIYGIFEIVLTDEGNKVESASYEVPRNMYMGSVASIEDEYDLAAFLGSSMEKVCNKLPDVSLVHEAGQIVAENQAFRMEGDIPENGDYQDAIVSCIELKDTDSLYTLWGITYEMEKRANWDEINSILAEKGLSPEGGSGEYFDADENLFDVFGHRFMCTRMSSYT